MKELCSFGVWLFSVCRSRLAKENKFQKANGPLKHSFAALMNPSLAPSALDRRGTPPSGAQGLQRPGNNSTWSIFHCRTPLGSMPSSRLQSQRMASPQIYTCLPDPRPWLWLCLPSRTPFFTICAQKSQPFFNIQLQYCLPAEV